MRDGKQITFWTSNEFLNKINSRAEDLGMTRTAYFLQLAELEMENKLFGTSRFTLPKQSDEKPVSDHQENPRISFLEKELASLKVMISEIANEKIPETKSKQTRTSSKPKNPSPKSKDGIVESNLNRYLSGINHMDSRKAREEAIIEIRKLKQPFSRSDLKKNSGRDFRRQLDNLVEDMILEKIQEGRRDLFQWHKNLTASQI